MTRQKSETTTDLFMINGTATPTMWSEVCAVSDLEPEWGEAALLDDQQLAVFRLWDDRIVVTSNIDPRTGSAVLSRGIVGTRAGCPTIASPLHKECYSLLTGECFDNPQLRLEIVPARILNGRVEVRRRRVQDVQSESCDRLSA